LNHPNVAAWEQIEHQRERFRAWEAGTALFIDSLQPLERNYRNVLDFVTKDEVPLKPLEEMPLTEGRYHE